jgi:hypothetical protein
MEYIGIDLGSRESQLCIRNEAGEIVKEVRCRTAHIEGLLARRLPARVIFETCTEAFRIAGKVQQQGHDVRVVAATLVSLLTTNYCSRADVSMNAVPSSSRRASRVRLASDGMGFGRRRRRPSRIAICRKDFAHRPLVATRDGSKANGQNQ